MIETIQFNNKHYPAFQAQGNAAQFAIPFARHFCNGVGFDIGCNKSEWAYPGAMPIDPTINENFNANNLPDLPPYVDYIFSSHCLEHVEGSWVETLKYWKTRLKTGGVIFLYLPDFSQEYWRPWNNTKHVHIFSPGIIKEAFLALGLSRVFVSGVDLNNSFMAVGQNG